MNIWDSLMERTTGMRISPTLRDKVSLRELCEPTGGIRPHQTDSNEEYLLRLAVEVTFWANKAQYGSARKIAEKHLAHVLYGGALAKIATLRSAISDGDRDAAMAACEDLEAELTQQ